MFRPITIFTSSSKQIKYEKGGLSESKTAERASITSSRGNRLNQTVRDSNYFLPKPADYKAFSLKLQLQFKRCERLKAKTKIDWKDR